MNREIELRIENSDTLYPHRYKRKAGWGTPTDIKEKQVGARRLRIEIPSQIKRGNGLGHADSEGKGNLGLRGERRNLLRSKKIIGILLLVIMFTSPFAFASGVKTSRVLEFKSNKINLIERGQSFKYL